MPTPTPTSCSRVIATATWQRPRAARSSGWAVERGRSASSIANELAATASDSGVARREHSTSIVSARAFIPVAAHNPAGVARVRCGSSRTQRGASAAST